MPSISDQISTYIEDAKLNGYEGKFLAYFQTGSNTYADLEVLKNTWQTVENFSDDIVAIAIGTRPDCLEESHLEILTEMSKQYMIWLEVGLQSANDETLKQINRGHDFHCFKDAVHLIQQYPSIYLCTHLILGLPGETESDIYDTVDQVNQLGIQGVKLHHLQVIKDTVLETWYNSGEVELLTEEAYVQLAAEVLARLSPDIVIHRMVGTIFEELLIAPHWQHRKPTIIQLIEKRMRHQLLYQGKLSSS